MGPLIAASRLLQEGPLLAESYFSRRLHHQVFRAVPEACSLLSLRDYGTVAVTVAADCMVYHMKWTAC